MPHHDRIALQDDIDVLYGDVLLNDDTSSNARANAHSQLTRTRFELAARDRELKELKERVETLELNASCVFNTALREIERKDNEIARLRDELARVRGVENARMSHQK